MSQSFLIQSFTKVRKIQYGRLLKGAHMMNIIQGYVESKIEYKYRTIHETLYVLENQKCGLLSRRASVELGVVRLIDEITEINL